MSEFTREQQAVIKAFEKATRACEKLYRIITKAERSWYEALNAAKALGLDRVNGEWVLEDE